LREDESRVLYLRKGGPIQLGEDPERGPGTLSQFPGESKRKEHEQNERVIRDCFFFLQCIAAKSGNGLRRAGRKGDETGKGWVREDRTRGFSS